MSQSRWPYKTAVGSSYCLDQSPGAERYGGLTITIRWPSSETGTITCEPTDRRTGQMLDDAIFGNFTKAAERGVRDIARELNVNLNGFDVVIFDFAYHVTDSFESVFYGAARSAFRSAWEAWERFYGLSPNATC